MSLAARSFDAPVAGSGQAVGAACTETVTLQATAKGTSTVVLRYSQPWLGGASNEWTYILTVTVRQRRWLLPGGDTARERPPSTLPRHPRRRVAEALSSPARR